MATQPNKEKAAWEGADDGEGERLGEWEEALRRVREKDADERKRKVAEAEEEKRIEVKRLKDEYWLRYKAEEKKRAAEILKQKMIARENGRSNMRCI